MSTRATRSSARSTAAGPGATSASSAAASARLVRGSGVWDLVGPRVGGGGGDADNGHDAAVAVESGAPAHAHAHAGAKRARQQQQPQPQQQQHVVVVLGDAGAEERTTTVTATATTAKWTRVRELASRVDGLAAKASASAAVSNGEEMTMEAQRSLVRAVELMEAVVDALAAATASQRETASENHLGAESGPGNAMHEAVVVSETQVMEATQQMMEMSQTSGFGAAMGPVERVLLDQLPPASDGATGASVADCASWVKPWGADEAQVLDALRMLVSRGRVVVVSQSIAANAAPRYALAHGFHPAHSQVEFTQSSFAG